MKTIIVQGNKMGIMPIRNLIFGMALPPMISMLMQALYSIVDSIFLAKVSESALTAVTLIFPLQMVLMAVNSGIGVGVASLISRKLGQGRRSDADAVASHGLVFALMQWGLNIIVAVFLIGPFLTLYLDPVADAEIFGMAILYFRIVTIGSFSMSFLVVIERIVQATGNMVYPMISSITGAVINTALAPIFIIGYFGIPGFGIAGAGGVAIFGQTIGFFIAFFLLKFKVKGIRASLKGFHWDAESVKNILAVGGPTMIMMSIGAFFTSAFNAILITYSTSAVAVMGVYFRIQTFVFLPVSGLGQGSLPVMGFNYGAKNRLRLISAFRLQILLACTIFIIGLALFQLFPVQLLRLFNAEGDMMEIGTYALRIISLHFAIAGFVVPCICMFQATAHAGFAMVISIVRQLGFLLPMAWFLSVHFGVNATWYAFPIAEGFTAILAAIFLRSVYKNDIQNIPDGAPAT